MNEHITCLICNSSKLHPLKEYIADHLVRCRECSFVFAKKIPSQLELATYYEGYGRDDYLSPVTVKRYHELLDRFEKYRRTNKMLDVGCGIGYFLEEAKKRGWDVYGTEFTSEAVSICEAKGFNMKKGVLDVTNYQLEEYDVITSFEVIEHIGNPMEEIMKFHQLLRKGGLLYITTPNFNSFLRFILRANYNVISYPEHLLYFTKKTLNLALSENNFNVLAINSTGLSLSRTKAGLNISTTKPIDSGSDDEKLRTLADNNTVANAFLQLANIILNRTGLGDALKSMALKS